MATSKRRATYDDVVQAPEHLIAELDRWIVAGAHGGEERLAGVEPFEGVVLDLSRWWIEATASPS